LRTALRQLLADLPFLAGAVDSVENELESFEDLVIE
jgi:hypothetical protein